MKRFFRERDRVRLQPENAELAPIYASEVEILGRVVGLMRALARGARWSDARLGLRCALV